ncbi:MAG TPA: toxin-antitoxin system YwqK family antitoxin [Bacteroidia bacterium]|jgi:antitoxin component YwqK of YwqJK toxin-antitoxin module
MKKFLLIILFVTVKIGLAQSNDTLNVTDVNGLKQGHWLYHGKDKNLPNYQPESKVEEGRYTDNRKDGIWVTYWPNGNKKSEITFVNNTAKGYAKMYYEDGKVSEEGNWENQRWTGGYKMYHPNGQVFYEFNYNKSGKREGKQTYYYDNGKVMMTGDMKDGKETGTWTENYETGDLKSKKGFNDGKLDPTQFEVYAPKTQLPPPKKEPEVKGPPPPDASKLKKNGGDPIQFFSGNGPAKLYNLNRQISQDGVFKNYKLIDGKNYIYSKDGILIQIAVYKNGAYVGDAPIEDDKK